MAREFGRAGGIASMDYQEDLSDMFSELMVQFTHIDGCTFHLHIKGRHHKLFPFFIWQQIGHHCFVMPCLQFKTEVY